MARVVKVKLNENDAPGHLHSRVLCARCSEGVNDGREVNSLDGSTLCRPCAFRVFHKKFVSNELNDISNYMNLSNAEKKSDLIAH